MLNSELSKAESHATEVWDRLAFASRTDDQTWVFFRLHSRLIPLGSLVLGLFLGASSSSAADFHVAPTGSDANPGTKRKPFASLARARDAVRDARQRNSNCDYTVLLRGGVYRLRETVVVSM